MPRVIINAILFLVVIVASCEHKPSTVAQQKDLLTAYPIKAELGFVGANQNDQIALILRRDSVKVFSY
ncbi:hypothetical protein [Pseudochryseolinea flava]|uniref:Uncharacterized protein n=1 Tax=Pseudochryseolinea flava TaxID=2059302 RepID=A0A364Y5C5_9BACT|nr:hypothetical protein [Pseudochryseolinea flava]RAW01378.1 hypothetical protein DQQ10_10775 [Pseudochryseolinea flava]